MITLGSSFCSHSFLSLTYITHFPPLVPIILSISRTCPHIFVGGDPIFRASQTLLNFNRTFDCCLSTDQTLVERENSQLYFFWRSGPLDCFPLTRKWGRGSGLDPVFLQLSKENWDCGSSSKLEGGSQTRSTGITRSSGLRGKKAFVHLSATHSFILFLQRFCRPVHIQCSMGVKHVWRKSSGIIFSQAKNELGKILTGHYSETVEKSSMLYDKIAIMLLSFEYLEHM